MSTINSVGQAVDALRTAFDLHVRDDLNVYEDLGKRIKADEEQTALNTVPLRDIKAATDFIKASLRILKWAAIAICSAVLWQVGTLLYHLIFH
jgi:hypothetical protein